MIRDPGEKRYQLYGPNGMRMGPPAMSFDEAVVYAGVCTQWNSERKRA